MTITNPETNPDTRIRRSWTDRIREAARTPMVVAAGVALALSGCADPTSTEPRVVATAVPAEDGGVDKPAPTEIATETLDLDKVDMRELDLVQSGEVWAELSGRSEEEIITFLEAQRDLAEGTPKLDIDKIGSYHWEKGEFFKVEETDWQDKSPEDWLPGVSTIFTDENTTFGQMVHSSTIPRLPIKKDILQETVGGPGKVALIKSIYAVYTLLSAASNGQPDSISKQMRELDGMGLTEEQKTYAMGSYPHARVIAARMGVNGGKVNTEILGLVQTFPDKAAELASYGEANLDIDTATTAKYNLAIPGIEEHGHVNVTNMLDPNIVQFSFPYLSLSTLGTPSTQINKERLTISNGNDGVVFNFSVTIV